jgi:hypothetical protein
MQVPAPNLASLVRCGFNAITLRRVENNYFLSESLRVCFKPLLLRWQKRRFVLIAKAIDGAALVTVQPCSVGTKRNQES